MIVQDDRFDATDSVTVLPLTSTEVDAPLLRMRISAGGIGGLTSDSFVMIDKLTTVRRTTVGQRIGQLGRTELIDLERLLMVFLGLAD